MIKTLPIGIITTELQDLTNESRQEVYDFIEFLKLKDENKIKRKKKEILLNAPTWSEDQIQLIENAQKDINRWKIKGF